VSSCDGFAAFLGEKPDHKAVDYFQGLEQFWQPGMPVKLPVTLRQKVRQQPELLDIKKKMSASSGDELESLKRDQSSAIARLEKQALLSYRKECLESLQQDRLLHGCKSEESDPDPLGDAVPERRRLAAAMCGDQSIGLEEFLKLSHDIQLMLGSSGSAFYRPNEALYDGKCKYCNLEVKTYIHTLFALAKTK